MADALSSEGGVLVALPSSQSQHSQPQALPVLSTTAAAHERLAVQRWQAADVPGALQAYNAALADYQTLLPTSTLHSAHCWTQVAQLLSLQQHQQLEAFSAWKQAERLYESLLETDVRAPQLWAETLQEQGIAYIQQQDYSHAMACHEQVVQKWRSIPDHVLQISMETLQTLIRTMGGDVPVHVSAAASRKNHRAEAVQLLLRQLAAVHTEKGHWERAISLLDSIQPATPDTLDQRGWIYEQQGEFEAAQQLYEQALLERNLHLGEYHVETTKSLFAVARVMGLSGNTEGSGDLYQAAQQKYIQHVVMQGADDLPPLLACGDYQQAVVVLNQCLELNGEDEDVDKSRLYYDLGRAYIGVNDYVSATICLVEAAKEVGTVTEEQVVALLQHVDFLQRNTVKPEDLKTGAMTPLTMAEESDGDGSTAEESDGVDDEATAYYDSEPEAGLDCIPRSDVSSSGSESLSDLPSIAIDPVPNDEDAGTSKELGSLASSSFLTPPESAPRELVASCQNVSPVSTREITSTERSRSSRSSAMMKLRQKKKSFAGKFRRRRKKGFESLENEEDSDREREHEGKEQEFPCEEDYHSLTTKANFEGPIPYVSVRSSSWETGISQITLRIDDPNSSRETSQEWWWGVTSEGFARWFPAAYVSQAVEAAEGFLSAKAIHEKKNTVPEALNLLKRQDGVESVDERISQPQTPNVDLVASNYSQKDAGSTKASALGADSAPALTTAPNGSVYSSSMHQAHATTDLTTEIVNCRDRLTKEQKEYGKSHPDVAMSHFTLAVLYSRNQSVLPAVESATEALKIQKANGSTVDAIRSLHFLADLHLHQKQFKSSLSYFSEALRLESNHYGYYSDETAQTLNCIGATRSLQNEFALAMESHQEALRILKDSHGEDPKHPLVSDTLCQIGSVYYRERNSLTAIKTKDDGYSTFIEGGMLEVIGRAHEDRGSYKMAISFFQEKLQFLENRGESEEALEEAATTLNSLGMLSTRAGLYVEAIDFYERALSLQLQLGCDEVDLAQARVLTGAVHCHLGHWAEALKLLQEALAVLQRELGEEHETVAATLYQLGIVYANLLEHKLALDVLNQALESQTNMLGDDHPATLRTRREIGKLCTFHESEVDSAIEIFNDVLEVQQEIHGKNHPNVADTLHCIGCAHALKEDYPSALAALEECYYMRLEFLGWDHPSQASTLHEITKIHMARGRLEKASHICDVVLRIRSEALTDKHIDVAKTLATKGSCWVARGDVVEGSKCLTAALSMAKKAVGERHPWVADIHTEIGLLYLRKCQFEEAREEIKLALDIYEEAEYTETHPSVRDATAKLARVERDEMLCV